MHMFYIIVHNCWIVRMPESPVAAELADVCTLALLASPRIIMFGMTRPWANIVCGLFGEHPTSDLMWPVTQTRRCHFCIRKAEKWQKTMTINASCPKKTARNDKKVPQLHCLFGNEAGKSFCRESYLETRTGSDVVFEEQRHSMHGTSGCRGFGDEQWKGSNYIVHIYLYIYIHIW